MNTASILQAIEDAQLKPVEYRAARRMLDRVSDRMTLYLERDEACALFEVDSWPGARKLLNRLKDIGIIDCHTNNRAYVIFNESLTPQQPKEPRQNGAKRADLDLQRADLARQPESEPRQNGSPARQNGAKRADLDLQRAKSARAYRLTNTGRQAKAILPEPEGGVGETPEPEPTVEAERQRSKNLLMEPEVGLDDMLATQLATEYTFEEIRRQTFRFLRDRQSGTVKSAGVLKSRLARRFTATITETDRASPLWAKYGDAPAGDAAADEPGEYAAFVIQ